MNNSPVKNGQIIPNHPLLLPGLFLRQKNAAVAQCPSRSLLWYLGGCTLRFKVMGVKAGWLKLHIPKIWMTTGCPDLGHLQIWMPIFLENFNRLGHLNSSNQIWTHSDLDISNFLGSQKTCFQDPSNNPICPIFGDLNKKPASLSSIEQSEPLQRGGWCCRWSAGSSSPSCCPKRWWPRPGRGRRPGGCRRCQGGLPVEGEKLGEKCWEKDGKRETHRPFFGESHQRKSALIPIFCWPEIGDRWGYYCSAWPRFVMVQHGSSDHGAIGRSDMVDGGWLPGGRARNFIVGGISSIYYKGVGTELGGLAE